jgi:predicted O-linked N-acetylglucosamine transferase (SPINDLY family)
MDYFSYFLAFARLAKVQTVGWGHPVTTGLPAIDLFLSVADMEPTDGEQHYSERLVRMKSLSIDVERPVLSGGEISRADLGLEAKQPAYVCAQSLYKVHHDFDETIGLILRNDPDSWVYFISHGPHADQLFLKRLEGRTGRDAARVRILPRMSSERFLHLLKAADVLLDVPQWSGGKTSLEGLSLGTPIVHRSGAFMRGRHTLAFYRCMGITKTVVETAPGYAEMATKLVHERAFRTEIREQIAATSVRLFGDRGAVRETERVWLDALGNPQ